MGFTLDIYSPLGRHWHLLEGQCRGGVGVKPGGLPGVAAKRTAAVVEPAGWHPRLIPGRSVVEPSDGDLAVQVRATRDKSTEVLWREFQGAFDFDAYSTLVLTTPEGVEYQSQARLGKDGYPDPEVLGVAVMECSVPLVRDRSTWARRMRRKSTGAAIKVDNFGDSDIYVSVRWKNGGQVTLPSGASFTLPAVQDWRTVHLDKHQFFSVVDDAGQADNETWRKIYGTVKGELVPRNTARSFTIPTGAQLVWNVEVNNPWA